MKNFLILLCLIFSIASFSQKKRDTLSYYDSYEPTKAELRKCKKARKENRKLFDQLSQEAKIIDFKKLTPVIIKDLKNSDFKGEVILFHYNYSNTGSGNMSSERYSCEKEYNTTNPFYSIWDWTYRDIISLSKVLNEKFIVPGEKNFGFSISNRLFGDDLEKELSPYKEFKSGTVYDKEVDKQHQKFYYLTEKKTDKELQLKTDFIYNTVLNYSYDTLYFKFRNLPGYKVQVTIIINSNSISKTYEYDNGEWILTDTE